MTYRPTKPRPAGSIEALLGELLRAAGGVEAAAELLDLAPSTLYGHADPQQKASRISFYDVQRLTRITGSHAALYHLAAMLGATVLPALPAGGDADWRAFGAEASREFAEVIATLFLALDPSGPAGGRIAPEEARSLRARIDPLLRQLSAALRRLDEIASPEGEAQQ